MALCPDGTNGVQSGSVNLVRCNEVRAEHPGTRGRNGSSACHPGEREISYP
jgi:hypothetical protein